MQRFRKSWIAAIGDKILAELKVCSSRRDLERGKRIHAQAVESGTDSWIYVANALVNMYAKCGSMADARRVFDGIPHPNVVSWNSLMLGYSDNGQGLTALDLLAKMKSQGCLPTSITYVAALKACSCRLLIQSKRAECLQWGKQIHSEIGSHLNIYVKNTLIDMYGKCGSMAEARHIFNDMKRPEVVSWNVLMMGYADNGEGITALDLFVKMKDQGCVPTSVTYLAALKACSSVGPKEDRKEWLLKLHLEIGSHSDICVQNTLIDMHAKYGSMVDARKVFDSIKNPDVVSWNALLLGYSDNGEGLTTLDLLAKMKLHGCTPNCTTYVASLKACTSLTLKDDAIGRSEGLERGRMLHSEIGCQYNIYVENTLIDMYAKCGSMIDAHRVFDSIKNPVVVSWNSLLSGYSENGESSTTLELFARMKSQGCTPDCITFVVVLKACGMLGALESGSKIHEEIDAEIEADVILVTCLVDFYAKCASLMKAQKVFDSYPGKRDLTTWNALLAGFSRLGDTKSVFGLFGRMQDGGFRPNGITLLCILTCCSHAGLVEKASKFFEAMTSTNSAVTPNIEHYNCMVDILGRSNKLDDAIALLQSMPCRPCAVTWTAVLGACRKWKNVEIGRLAFSSLVSLDETNAAAYVLMAHVYGSRGMWEEQKMVFGMRKQLKVRKIPGQSCWTNEVGEVHTFLVGDSKHPQIQEIHAKLKAMVVKMREHGYVVDLFSISYNITEEEKEEALCGHSEKLAIACALINTEPGKTIRIVKNLRVCDDCHTATLFISKLEQRTIICRDASRFHVFNDGKCSCGNFW